MALGASREIKGNSGQSTRLTSIVRRPEGKDIRHEIITQRDRVLVRRLVLEPGEAMLWHTDLCHRVSVVVRGDEIRIEFRDTSGHTTVPVHSGMVGWDEPEGRVHRGFNSGSTTYEEVVTFFLDDQESDPQPSSP